MKQQECTASIYDSGRPARSETGKVQEVERDDILQLPEIGRANASDGVPALRRLRRDRSSVSLTHATTTTTKTYVEARGAAARVVADRDVVERGRAERLDGVDERVQEPERREALLEASRVQERDDAGERRRRRGCTADGHRAPGEEDTEQVRLRGDVGDSLMVESVSRRAATS